MAFSFFNKENRAEEYFNKGSHFEGLKSRSEAVYWYTKAAEMGNAKAQFALGNCYSQKGVAIEDKDKAFEWYTKAAEQGHAGAQFALGNCYWDGKGVYTNKKIAIEWYTKAGEHGHAEAQHTLGQFYAEGKGVMKSWKKASEWFAKAAEQGHAEAQFNLGMCYATGKIMGKDMVKAVDWYEKAAEQGNAEAQYNLGLCYYQGEGVEKDMKKAVEWYTKAAEKKHTSAEIRLAFCYYEGEGIIKDVGKASKYRFVDLMKDYIIYGPSGWEDGKATNLWKNLNQTLNSYCMAIYFGKNAYLERNYPKALRMFDLASDIWDLHNDKHRGGSVGGSVLPYLWKGKVYAKLDKYEPALSCFDKAVKNASMERGGDPDMTEALREKAKILISLKQIKEARKTLKAALESAITHNQSSMIAEVENELKVLPPDEDTLNNVTYLSAETLIQGNVGVYAKDDAIVNRPVVGDKGSDDPKNIYCPYCGRKHPVDARFCMGCGKKLEEGE